MIMMHIIYPIVGLRWKAINHCLEYMEGTKHSVFSYYYLIIVQLLFPFFYGANHIN